MKALRWHGKGDLRLDRVRTPNIAPDEVLIRVAYSGISSSEVREYVAGPIFIPLDPHPLTGSKAPQVLGHEFGGYVAKVGSGIDDVHVGTLVAVDPMLSCGHCNACLSNRPNLCDKLAFYGLIGNGGHADFAVVKAANCIPLPGSIPPEYVAFAEPAAVAYHAVNQAGIEPGASVAVLGGGPIGQLVAQYARAAGASKVILTEIAPGRISLARSIGAADWVVDPMEVNAEAEILDITGGEGVHCAIECCGGNKAGMFEHPASQAVRLTRHGGTAVILGTFAASTEFNLNNLVIMERRVIGSWAWHSRKEYEQAIEMIIDGTVKVLPLVSRRVRIEKAIADGIQALYLNGDGQSKILIDLN